MKVDPRGTAISLTVKPRRVEARSPRIPVTVSHANEKEAPAAPRSRALPWTTSESADAPVSDACFLLAKQAGRRRGSSDSVVVRSGRAVPTYNGPRSWDASASLGAWCSRLFGRRACDLGAPPAAPQATGFVRR